MIVLLPTIWLRRAAQVIRLKRHQSVCRLFTDWSLSLSCGFMVVGRMVPTRTGVCTFGAMRSRQLRGTIPWPQLDQMSMGCSGKWMPNWMAIYILLYTKEMPRWSPKIFAQQLRWILNSKPSNLGIVRVWKTVHEGIFVIDPPKALFLSTNNKEFGHRIAEEWCWVSKIQRFG